MSKFPVRQAECCWIVIKKFTPTGNTPAKLASPTAMNINVRIKMLVKGKNKNKEF